MIEPAALVSIGQTITVGPSDFRYGHAPTPQSETHPLHLRVTHVPKNLAAVQPDWVAVLGVELQPDGGDGPHQCVVVRTRALPGYQTQTPEPTAPGGPR
jgi:hypothetical protein